MIWEDSSTNGHRPLAADANEDADNDGLSNADELRNGTNPFIADCDDDGFSDGVEVSGGSSPTDPDSTPGARGMALGVRDLLTAGRLTAGMDAVHLDVNRNGRLDVGDLVTRLGPAGPALDPSTAFTLGPGSARGAAGRVARLPVFLSPGGLAAAFSVEVKFDPDVLQVISVVPGPGLASRQLAVGQPEPGCAVLVGYSDPPTAIGGSNLAVELLVRVREGLPVSSLLPVKAVRGAVADPAGNLMPIVNLRRGTIILTASARRWSLYR